MTDDGGLIDLRSDTVTAPTAGMRAGDGGRRGRRRRLRRGPERQRARGAGRCDVRPRSGGLRPVRDHGQPDLPSPGGAAGRRAAVRRRRAHRDLRGRRRCPARGHPDPHRRRDRRWTSTPTWRSCARRAGAPLPTSAIAVEQTHNRGGGLVHPFEPARGAATAYPAGLRPALRRGPDLERVGRHRRPAARVRGAVRHPLGLPVQGTRRARGLAGRDVGGARRRRPASSGAGSAAACARPGSWPLPARYALDHHLERLADDHAHARLLAEACGVDPESVDTNIVVIFVRDAPSYVAAARTEGCLSVRGGSGPCSSGYLAGR